ncbi:hypothetical protein [Novosphingobium huizhouense]|uniref:hypothetical protein n=1 Tax=Novosphingobium huizhouense TaxID=2866625 RepID=UPI001CD8EBA3|nr:hypothetical protein [Novosphingobium huizhouense]
MKKLVFAALVPAALLSAAAPASAQGWGQSYNNGYNNGYSNGWRNPSRNADIRQDINQLRWQIDRAQQRRAISWREADYLRREVGKIQRQYADFARGGLDRYEHAALERRVGFVQDKLRAERWDRDGHRG